jgi:ABC-type branched-subunit amino acid transport system substrate-binding protein
MGLSVVEVHNILMTESRFAVRRGGQSAARALLALAAFCLIAPSLLWAQLNEQQTAGKQIFTEGSSQSKTGIEAILGGGTSRIPGRLMPCASCHGADGQGRPEGGVTPSNITWDVLERPLTSSDPLARNRPAYDGASLRRAITEGIDPAGHELGVTMPRFRMSDADLDSLIAYLSVLGKESDPGLTNTDIRIGTIIPATGPLAETGTSFAEIIGAYLKDVNAQGGIYGRKIDLQVLRTEGAPSEIAAAAKRFVKDKNIFALLGVVAPGAEQKVEDAMDAAGVPVITAFATRSGADEASEKSKVFYVLSGLSQQARVLVRFAREHIDSPSSSITVVFPESRHTLAESVIRECHNHSFASVVPVNYSSSAAEPARIVESLRKKNVNAILFLGDGGELHNLLLSAKAANWFPAVFQPGEFAGKDVFDIPPEFNQRVYFSFPVLPSDVAADAFKEYETLLQAHRLKIVQPLLSTSVLASAKVLAEGLREAGRQLSRQKLVDTLSALYGFNTGLTPLVTYGATRRIGALGGYVVKLDLKNKTLLQVQEWMAP